MVTSTVYSEVTSEVMINRGKKIEVWVNDRRGFQGALILLPHI